MRDTWSNVVMIGPTVIHHSKIENTYDTALRAVTRKKNLSNETIGIVTDGKTALINACKNVFTKLTALRCTNYFKENCKDYLKSIGIKNEADQGLLLDIIFGEDDLRQKIKQAFPLIDELESKILQENESDSFEPKFSGYLKEREKKVIRKLIRDARKKGGMPLDPYGVPTRSYTNQSETVNSMLSSSKIALGYSKKEDVSKIQFVKRIWEPVIVKQDADMERALYGQSKQFRLTKKAKYLEVEAETWFNWTEQQRKRCV